MKKKRKADFVINNNFTKQNAKKSVKFILNQILK